MNRIHAETHIVAMKPTRIVRRRREVQAYYGSAQSDGSRLPFLLEPPAAAKALASRISSPSSVAARVQIHDHEQVLACYLLVSPFT
jgi:hypothetical protein